MSWELTCLQNNINLQQALNSQPLCLLWLFSINIIFVAEDRTFTENITEIEDEHDPEGGASKTTLAQFILNQSYISALIVMMVRCKVNNRMCLWGCRLRPFCLSCSGAAEILCTVEQDLPWIQIAMGNRYQGKTGSAESEKTASKSSKTRWMWWFPSCFLSFLETGKLSEILWTYFLVRSGQAAHLSIFLPLFDFWGEEGIRFKSEVTHI